MQSTKSSPILIREAYRRFVEPSPCVIPGLEDAGMEVTYPRGATLFMEGNRPQNVFFVTSGCIKLSVTSSEGKTVIVRIARPGAVLGLSATLASTPYEVTAEAIENSRVQAVPVKQFVKHLEDEPEAATAAARLILKEYQVVFNNVRRLALPSTVAGRLANLLLEWLRDHFQSGRTERRFVVSLTQEEIAAMAGTSRETVSRVLQQFQRDKVIAIKGASVTVLRPEVLEQLTM
jgi:CRP/FNR family transcriptional regulator